MTHPAFILAGLLVLNVNTDPTFTEQVTVTASRTPIAVDDSGTAITILEREAIELRQSFFLSDLLRGVPGIAISQSGPMGSLTQARLRGGEADQLLVSIGGVPVNDVFAGDQIPLELLTSYDIERIEVARGPQSGLWGSDAVSGVVNIQTPELGARRPEAQIEAGSFGTWRGAGTVGFEQGASRLTFSGSYLDSDGTNVSRTGDEDDGTSSGTATLRYQWQPADRPFELDVLGRHTDADADFDAIDFFTTGLPVDDDRTTSTQLNLLSVTGRLAPDESRWRHQLTASVVGSDTETFIAAAPSGATAIDKQQLGWQSSVAFGGEIRQDVIFAVDHKRREFTQRGTATPFGDPNQTQEMGTTGAVVEYRIKLPKRWSFAGSLRHDRNSDFADVTTYRASTRYALAEGRTRLRASAGTGQKAPTFLERFGFFADTFIGNPNLDPERSTGWDVGLDQQLGKKARIALTWFRDRLEDEIDGFVFDPALGAFTAENEAGVSHRQGLEVELDAALADAWHLGGSYTFTDATQPEVTGSDEEELRRPRHLASLRLHYDPERIPFDLLVNLSQVGSQVDRFFPPFPQPSERLRLDSYLLVDVTARYGLSERIELFGRVENALDEDYEDIVGFATPGIAAHVGLRFRAAR